MSEVDKPEHYNTGDIECIDAIRSALSPTAFEGYLQANVLKYVWRYNYKGRAGTDLRKAKWYLNRLIELHPENTEKEVISTYTPGPWFRP